MVKIIQSKAQSYLYLYSMWKQKEDAESSERLADVIRKYEKGEFMIAFCGHFSAGKSTMMNALYGEDLLPTSPIPTSANVVKVRRGKNQVVATLLSGERHSYEGIYTDEQLKALCKNGDEVIGIEIARENAPLPEGVILVDTPGIDSTDDAHRLATESTLHLADIIFYMMDYNHVQSEVNLQFVKELKERNKCVYLVINQIDKHKEDELSFSSYQESVAASFSNWNIHVDGIFYTSLRSANYKYNEFQALKSLIASLMEQRATYIETSTEREVAYLLEKHRAFLLHKHEETSVGADNVDIQEVEQILTDLYRKEEQLLLQKQTIKSNFLKGLDQLLENAYLLPFEVRSLAESYLETELSNFKVGWFFSKTKTQKEKEKRLQLFYEKFRETAQTQLDFHVRQYLLTFLQEQNIYTEEVGKRIYGISATFSTSLLTDNIKRGAGLTGDYVLNYTNDVATALKKQIKQTALHVMEEQFLLLAQNLEKNLVAIQNEIVQYESKKTAEMLVKEQEQSMYEYIQELYKVFAGEKQPEITVELLPSESYITSEQMFKVQHAESIKLVEIVSATPSGDIATVIQYIKQAEKWMKSVPALKHLYEEAVEKRQRAETKQFTVALFGAFSAGKSSFANAMLGNKVLPVSPNPTTAAINKIMPVTQEHPHGTVVVQFKTADALLEDLQHIYKLFEQKVTTLEEAIAGIPALLAQSSPNPRQKTTLSFLRAVQSGYTIFKQQLGCKYKTELSQFASYVAEEEKSCFVEYMELYYDCAFTQNGITLVDTPGADSVNARHTDVAFQYIKNADAILFVTYYNHVFSKADREFLIQLGRVKDSFAMDKMFFLINAADLAADEQELQTVQSYIKGQLLQYGIRNPRMFPISSLFALDEKLGKKGNYGILINSGMSAFEAAFHTFVSRDLMMVSLTDLTGVVRSAENLLHKIVIDAKESIDKKEEKLRRYKQEQETIQHVIDAYSVLTEEQALAQEIQDLLYYVKQRVFFRYNDVFSEIFNPAVLRNDSDSKQRLRECIIEMVDFLKHDFMQEIRATSLRIENWMDKRLMFSKRAIVEECLAIHPGIGFSEHSRSYKPSEQGEPFLEMEPIRFKKAMTYFKNAKSFFEKNEKALFQEEMKNVLEPEASRYIEEEAEQLRQHYTKEWQAAWQKLKEELQSDTAAYFEGLLHALSDNVDVISYEYTKEQIEKIRKGLEKELNMI
ncbi:dynamin family protein [Ectobacillus antri]|jgi:predicted GTPase|uniref:Dynamin family protein n=1 Tax=Ectobacillus antri TaxID=2486280 RepID=A0ABT6H0V0_9BACI|nr:dynamin family protein [Ectobacillus antri]MDG4656158.1 dynamin family protein [Ectobacillus antri]MDG5752833.1 dynamin family protein [Ectobacillus antri]